MIFGDKIYVAKGRTSTNDPKCKYKLQLAKVAPRRLQRGTTLNAGMDASYEKEKYELKNC